MPSSTFSSLVQSGSGANALSLGASAISGLSKIVGGQQKARAANYDAETASTQASIVEQQAAADAQQTQQNARRQIGAAVTAFGASGVDPNQGSSLNIVSDLAQQGELSRQLVLYRGALQSNSYRQQAALDRYSAQQAGYAGIVSGGSTFLTDYTRYLRNQTPGGGGSGDLP